MTAASEEIDVRAHAVPIIAIGAMTGLLSGLLGIGGAAILVPGMVEVLGISQHKAAGTSLFVIIPTALVSAIIYALGEQMDWMLSLVFSLTAVIGAYFGARVMSRISAPMLRKIFGVFLMVVAIRLVLPGGPPADATFQSDVFNQSPLVTIGEFALGWVAGFMSGLLGIGGGQVLTPGMIFLFGVPQKLAQGISIAFIVPTAIAGAITHYRRGNVLPKVGLLLIPSSMIAGIVGSFLVHSIDANTLRIGFSFFLVYASIRMLAPALISSQLRRLRGA